MTQSSQRGSASSFLREKLRKTIRFIKRICVSRSNTSAGSSTRSPEQPVECTTTTQLGSPPGRSIRLQNNGNMGESVYLGEAPKRLKGPFKLTISKIETALRSFKSIAGVFPLLAAAVDDIIACLYIVEGAENYREDYKSLNLELETMAKTLYAIIGELGYDPEDQEQVLVRLARLVDKEANQISKKQNRGKISHILKAKNHEAYVVECYRRIQVWFMQLQAQTSFIMLQDSRMQRRVS
ncbi:hypothetical protein OPQ81_003108 [Rhizoctonia solani]|nr:hypothetical protein OPQ81_003108 [Rhizoctonia solani]